MEFIRIASGKYDGGARDGESGSDDDERPRHAVQITVTFEAGKFEVTQADYRKVMGVNPSYFSAMGDGSECVRGMDTSNFPVETVSWFDAIEFCNKLSELDERSPYYDLTDVRRSGETITSATVNVLGGNGYRLLTEAEWEYVARASTETVFPWGDDLSATQATFDGNHPYGNGKKGPSLERTSAVGSQPPNKWGLHDTVGNVCEWVWDWYDEDTYDQFATSTAVGPTGPSRGIIRVVRGGGWDYYGGICRPANRDRLLPDQRIRNLGFRVARGTARE